jgi:peptide chain release factor 2
VVDTLTHLQTQLADNSELYEMSRADDDHDALAAIEAEVDTLETMVAELEFRRMFSNPSDPLNCFIDIQAGAGGTEAMDWAQMLLRQYLRYCERKGFKAEVLEETEGDTAGIRSATLKVEGDHAFGLLRTETGVHRLVRKSPFDSAGGRHTSFASLFVYPEVDDSIEIDINPADVRTDTFRASGAGGQHINKTDSAVRLTHLPTASSCNARTAAASTATAMRPGACCAAGSTNTRCESSGRRSRSSRTARPTSAGATRSAATCSTRAGSRICARTWRSAIPRRCWTATSTPSSKPA